jgi:hypothetical protein
MDELLESVMPERPSMFVSDGVTKIVSERRLVKPRRPSTLTSGTFSMWISPT